jgi:hypothetical protein
MPAGKPDIPQASLLDDARKAQQLLALKFEDEQWDAPLRAIEAVVEFAGKASEWQNWPLKKWKNTPESVEAELEQIRQLMSDERDGYMPEILAQIDGSPIFYLGLLGISGEQKPWTRALINFALRVAEFVALHYKKVHKRARPSVLCPGLLPLFGPPSHPSFPSGHSTQSHLMGLLLLQIPEIAARFGPQPSLKDLQDESKDRGSSELMWLADRVAKNRERAGLHYRSDSVAGKQLAIWVVELLLGKDARYEQLIDASKEKKYYSAKVPAPAFWRLLINACQEWPLSASATTSGSAAKRKTGRARHTGSRQSGS